MCVCVLFEDYTLPRNHCRRADTHVYSQWIGPKCKTMHHPIMGSVCRLVLERFLALVTFNIWPSRVHISHVRLQIRRLRKTFATNFAGKRFRAGVHVHMNLQKGGTAKRFRTMFTFKVFGMRPQMSLQLGIQIVRPWTQFAFEYFAGYVCLFVRFQIVRIAECFVAFFAFVSGRIVCVQMLFQFGHKIELLIADGAWKSFFAGLLWLACWILWFSFSGHCEQLDLVCCGWLRRGGRRWWWRLVQL